MLPLHSLTLKMWILLFCSNCVIVLVVAIDFWL